MKNMKNIIFVLICALNFASSAKLPKVFTKCKLSDEKLNKCLKKNANDAWPTIINGSNKHHIHFLNPLKILSIINFLEGNLTNGVLSGLDRIHFDDVRVDFDTRRYEINFTQPYLTLTGDYKTNGELLGLPIYGEGVANLTYIRGHYKYIFHYEINKIKEKEYMTITNSDITYDVRRMFLTFDKLFDGEEKKGKRFNKLLDSNWRIVNYLLRKDISNALSAIYSQVLTDFFQRVPLSEFYET